MTIRNTVAGTIGRFRDSPPDLSGYSSSSGGRVLDVDGSQQSLAGGPATTTGRASAVFEETERVVTAVGSDITIGSETVDRRFGTSWAARGRVVYAGSVREEGGGTFPFTLLSAVAGVMCEHLHFETEAIRQAWEDDGVLSETWLAGTETDDATVMAYGEASLSESADIGLGFERAWEGYVLRGVVYSTGYLAVFEELSDPQFLRFVTEELVPFGFVEEEEAESGQSTLGEAES